MSRDLSAVEIADDFEEIALIDEKRGGTANGEAERQTGSSFGSWFGSLAGRLRGNTASTQGFQPLHNVDDASPSFGRGGAALPASEPL